jgi:hypothetical protein
MSWENVPKRIEVITTDQDDEGYGANRLFVKLQKQLNWGNPRLLFCTIATDDLFIDPTFIAQRVNRVDLIVIFFTDPNTSWLTQIVSRHYRFIRDGGVKLVYVDKDELLSPVDNVKFLGVHTVSTEEIYTIPIKDLRELKHPLMHLSRVEFQPDTSHCDLHLANLIHITGLKTEPPYQSPSHLAQLIKRYPVKLQIDKSTP